MLHDDFLDWARYHAKSFGMGANECESILTWYHPFDVLGFTAEDLRSATDWIITTANPLPKFVRDHLPLIRDYCSKLVQFRLDQLHATDREIEDKGTCTKCNDAIWIIVPHPQSYDADRRLTGNYLCGVVCNCQKGYHASAKMNQAILDAKGKDADRLKMPMSIGDYEAKYSDWRDQLELRNRAKSSVEIGCCDQVLDDGIRRILERAMGGVRS